VPFIQISRVKCRMCDSLKGPVWCVLLLRCGRPVMAPSTSCAAVDTDYEFKNCMRGRGSQFSYTHHGPSAGSGYEKNSRQKDDTFIDPDTGMSCRNIGGASICEPPQGTVKYQNRHGLNSRTGIVSICSNL
jgi:hypothetical protein